MKTKRMGKRRKQFLVWASISICLAALYAVFTVDLPYYIELPGGIQDVSSVLKIETDSAQPQLSGTSSYSAYHQDVRDVLQVNNEADSASGSYNFTYISIGQATVASLIYAWLTPYTDIYSEEEVTGGASNEDFNRINQFYMETSQNMAEYQGLTLAGEEVEMEYLGVYVLSVTDDSTFKGILNIADTVTGVNGKTFESSSELITYVSGLELGSEVKVTFTSKGKEKTEKGFIIKLENGKNGIGIGLTDHTKVVSSHKINYQTEGLGGPSAGLMFTLSIYTQIAEPNLRGGRVIAGTGTIEADGKVGDVGGVDKKVVAAARGGADIFFVPDNPLDDQAPEGSKSNYDEALEAAKDIGTDMKIVPVKTAQEAIDYLRSSAS